MKGTLDSLKYLANEGSFSNPFKDKVESNDSIKKYDFKKSSKKKKLDEFIEEAKEKLHDEDDYDVFDNVVADLDEFDEDSDLRNSLLSMGRKYARDYSTSGESNEVTKAFAPQEAHLTDLLAAVTRETARLEEDINEMRKMRSRNYGKISELVEVKGSLYNNQLQILKELNSVKKTQFDIKNKIKETTSSDDGYAAQSVVQSIFGLGHDTLLAGVGGRDGSSGAYDDVVDDSSEDQIYEEVMSSNEDDDSDGAKFLKYEGLGAHYVLEETEDGTRRVYAEDKDGNVIEDYPVPKDVDELRFEINQKNNTAIDQLQRKYEYRYI